MTEPREPSLALAEPETRPTLLAISPVPPWPPRDGMALRVSRLLQELSPRWSIVLICPAGGESSAENGVSLSAEINVDRASPWMYLPSQYDVRPFVKTVAETIRAHRPTVALFWGGMEYLRDAISDMPVSVSDRVDCMTLAAWRSLIRARGYAELRRQVSHFAHVTRYEFQMRRVSAATVVVGDADAKVLSRIIGVRNVQVIPNGVDVPVTDGTKRALRPTVMFTGVLSYQPNIDAVLYFADEIWPSVRARIPDAVFQIVGRSPTPEIAELGSRAGIELVADVKSVQVCLAEAWLAVAPMRTGAGIKNKILEAWSVGTPVVMTPIATNGLTQAAPELLLAAEGAELATLVIDLLLDPKRRASLGDLALSTAKSAFSWRANGVALDQLLRNVSR
ncbi:MAG: polysaccharide biosynthesis protein PslH [Gemmatimonadaceae bacterium]|nr:polysaccharide biosynthesis protein PslH [Gemmatimonadaceae bacterium]